MNNSPFATGAVITEPQASHFDLGSLTPENAPISFMPTYGLAIESQAQQPACGSHAGAELDDILKTIERTTIQRFSPQQLWKEIKKIDGLSVSDGTSLDAILKTLSRTGACDYALMPNQAETLSLYDYASPNTLTPEMTTNAVNNRIDSVYAFQYTPSFQDIKNAIYTHKAVILLIRMGAEFWTPSWKESDILPLKTTFPITSGHFITAYAYDENYIYFYNHWTAEWGRQGIGYFGADYASRVYCIGTAVDLATNFSFIRNLKMGMTGTDVGILQAILKKQGYFPANQSITSLFGSITEAAVNKFQLAHAKDILAPLGLTNPTGVVGQNTTKVLNTMLT